MISKCLAVLALQAFSTHQLAHLSSPIFSESFITSDRQAASTTFSLLILFGPAAAGFTYIVCFFFKSPSMANLFVIVFNFFIGMAGPLVCFILRVIAADLTNPKPNLKNTAIALEWILRLIPSFCLGKGLLYT